LDTIMNYFRSLDLSALELVLYRVLPAILCITLHELAHGFAAYRLGDDTAKRLGRLTLNPIKHVDIFGLIMIMSVGFGWAKPVPVDMRNFKNQKRDMAITALAGPLMNILIACVALLALGLLAYPLRASSAAGEIILSLLYRTARLSTALAIFNLIPIPPLDGSKIVFSFLNEKNYLFLMKYERFGMLALMALLFSGFLDKPLALAVSFVFEGLYKIAIVAFEIVIKLV